MPSEIQAKAERGSVPCVDPNLFASFKTEPCASVLAFQQSDREMTYYEIRCTCGSDVFRLSGWPRVVSGRGGFFWRSVARVWREAQLPVQGGELAESPIWLPVEVGCDRCGRVEALLDSERIEGRISPDSRAEPRESIRCRDCKRSLVQIVVGVAQTDCDEARDASKVAVEIVSRCPRCKREARVAWSEGRRDDQEIRLDLLYGRR